VTSSAASASHFNAPTQTNSWLSDVTPFTSQPLNSSRESDGDLLVDGDDLSDPEMDGSSNHAGLALGVTLALLAAAACTAAILYRRRRRGKKSTYITFGNPSYSREHLPANDFTLDSPLTLSSNGYTVLA
jgi:hypothetical protein